MSFWGHSTRLLNHGSPYLQNATPLTVITFLQISCLLTAGYSLYKHWRGFLHFSTVSYMRVLRQLSAVTQLNSVKLHVRCKINVLFFVIFLLLSPHLQYILVRLLCLYTTVTID